MLTGLYLTPYNVILYYEVIFLPVVFGAGLAIVIFGSWVENEWINIINNSSP